MWGWWAWRQWLRNSEPETRPVSACYANASPPFRIKTNRPESKILARYSLALVGRNVQRQSPRLSMECVIGQVPPAYAGDNEPPRSGRNLSHDGIWSSSNRAYLCVYVR